MIKRTGFVLVFLSVVLAGCRGDLPGKGTPHAVSPPPPSGSGLPGTPDPLSEWVLYANNQVHFALRHPPDLQVEAEDASGTLGWIGPRIQYAVTSANPLDCRGDCPLVDTVDANAEVVGRTATRFSGSIGSIGGRTPQQFLSYTFWIDDRYYTFTVFALKNGEAKDRVDQIWPLADEDRRLFEQIISTLEFGAISAAAATGAPARTAAVPAGTNAAPGSIGHLPQGTPLTMKNIFMVDALNGWGIGGKQNADEHILRTQDGGSTWLDVSPAEPAGLTGSKRKQALGYFRSPQRAWIAYWGGSPAKAAPTMWSTSDSGVTWTASAQLDGSGLGAGYSPEYLDFPDSVHGWLLVAHSPADGRLPASLFHTEDSGLHWVRIFDPFQAQGSDLHACCRVGMVFLDAFTGIIAQDVDPNTQLRLFWSRDSGQSWWPQELPAADPGLFQRAACRLDSLNLQAPNSPALAVSCSDPSDPTKPPQAFFYFTHDGGQSWSSLPLPTPPVERPPGESATQNVSLVFISPDYGWAILHDGYTKNAGGQSESRTHIYQTGDGGKTWEPRATVYWSGQFSFVSPLVGWAVATSGDQVALVKTIDGGQMWKVLEPKLGP